MHVCLFFRTISGRGQVCHVCNVHGMALQKLALYSLCPCVAVYIPVFPITHRRRREVVGVLQLIGLRKTHLFRKAPVIVGRKGSFIAPVWCNVLFDHTDPACKSGTSDDRISTGFHPGFLNALEQMESFPRLALIKRIFSCRIIVNFRQWRCRKPYQMPF